MSLREPAIEYMLGIGDITSANIFSDEGKSTSTTGRRGRGLIGQSGEQLYLAQLVEQPGN